jgi:cell division septation protein DedD
LPAQSGSAKPAVQNGQRANSLADSGAFELPAGPEPQFSRVELERQAAPDKYSLGVRLMRVSPLWLLVCGLVFVAAVAALNGLTSSAEQLNRETARVAAPTPTGNQATNQSGPANVPAQAARATSAAATVNKIEGARAPQQPAATSTPASPAAQTAQAATAKPTPQAATPRQPVEVKPAPVAAAQAGSGGKFTLQVGAYKTPVEANEHVARLQAVGFKAQVIVAELPSRGTWYRVQTGRFADRADAARAGAELRAKGVAESFIVSEVTAR